MVCLQIDEDPVIFLALEKGKDACFCCPNAMSSIELRVFLISNRTALFNCMMANSCSYEKDETLYGIECYIPSLLKRRKIATVRV